MQTQSPDFSPPSQKYAARSSNSSVEFFSAFFFFGDNRIIPFSSSFFFVAIFFSFFAPSLQVGSFWLCSPNFAPWRFSGIMVVLAVISFQFSPSVIAVDFRLLLSLAAPPRPPEERNGTSARIQTGPPFLFSGLRHFAFATRIMIPLLRPYPMLLRNRLET